MRRQPGDVGGRGEAVGAEAAVVQAHDALDHGDVRAAGAVQQQRGDPLLADEVRVQVAARAAGGDRVVARVDVVRTDLVAGDGVSAVAQGGHQARWRSVVLPWPVAGAADHQPRQPHHERSPLDALLALLAGVHRVLDLGHVR